jgi:hypothetical protein
MVRGQAVALAVAIVAAAGCYEYVPVAPSPALVGQRVRFELTDAGAVAMASALGPSIDAVEGTLLADSAQVYEVAIAATYASNGAEAYWRGERVDIQHALVAGPSARRFSASRTAFVAALGTVGLGAMTAALRGKGESGGGVPVVGPPAPK